MGDSYAVRRGGERLWIFRDFGPERHCAGRASRDYGVDEDDVVLTGPAFDQCEAVRGEVLGGDVCLAQLPGCKESRGVVAAVEVAATENERQSVSNRTFKKCVAQEMHGS